VTVFPLVGGGMGEGGRGACLRQYDNIYLSKTVFDFVLHWQP